MKYLVLILLFLILMPLTVAYPEIIQNSYVNRTHYDNETTQEYNKINLSVINYSNVFSYYASEFQQEVYIINSTIWNSTIIDAQGNESYGNSPPVYDNDVYIYNSEIINSILVSPLVSGSTVNGSTNPGVVGIAYYNHSPAIKGMSTEFNAITVTSGITDKVRIKIYNSTKTFYEGFMDYDSVAPGRAKNYKKNVYVNESWPLLMTYAIYVNDTLNNVAGIASYIVVDNLTVHIIPENVGLGQNVTLVVNITGDNQSGIFSVFAKIWKGMATIWSGFLGFVGGIFQVTVTTNETFVGENNVTLNVTNTLGNTTLIQDSFNVSYVLTKTNITSATGDFSQEYGENNTLTCYVEDYGGIGYMEFLINGSVIEIPDVSFLDNFDRIDNSTSMGNEWNMTYYSFAGTSGPPYYGIYSNKTRLDWSIPYWQGGVVFERNLDFVLNKFEVWGDYWNGLAGCNYPDHDVQIGVKFYNNTSLIGTWIGSYCHATDNNLSDDIFITNISEGNSINYVYEDMKSVVDFDKVNHSKIYFRIRDLTFGTWQQRIFIDDLIIYGFDSVYLNYTGLLKGHSLSYDTTGLGPGTYYFKCNVLGNENSTSNYTLKDYLVYETVSLPYWSNMTASPESPQNYTSQFYTFMVDFYNADTVLIENNFTGTMQNNSIIKSGNNYIYDAGILPAGTYQYRFIGTSTQGTNQTPMQYYVINKADPGLYFTFEPENPISFSKTINVTCRSIPPVTKIMAKDAYPVSNPMITTLPTGTYNMTCTSSGTANYLSGFIQEYLYVVNYPPTVQLTSPADDWVFPSTTTKVNMSFTVQDPDNNEFYSIISWDGFNFTMNHTNGTTTKELPVNNCRNYTWYVVTTYDFLSFVNTTTRDFEVLCPTITPLPTINIVSPDNGQEFASTTTQVTINYSTTSNVTAATEKVYVDGDLKCSSTVPSGPYHTCVVMGLVSNTTYYFNASINDGINPEEWTGTRWFRINETCWPDWVAHYTPCTVGDNRTKYYVDENYCGTTDGLPGDNGTTTYCDYCTPEWYCDTYGACRKETHMEECYSVTDTNNCYAQTGLPSDQFTGNIHDFDRYCLYEGVLFMLFAESGAGLSLFLKYITSPVGLLLMGIMIAAVMLAIGLAIVKRIKDHA